MKILAIIMVLILLAVLYCTAILDLVKILKYLYQHRKPSKIDLFVSTLYILFSILFLVFTNYVSLPLSALWMGAGIIYFLYYINRLKLFENYIQVLKEREDLKKIVNSKLWRYL